MTIRFGNSVAKKPMKCNDCNKTIDVGDWFTWDNWRKRLEGRAIALCGIDCKQLFQIDEEPKKVHRVKAADVTELRKQIEAYERDRSKLEEAISNLQDIVSTLNTNVNSLKTPSGGLSEDEREKINETLQVIISVLKSCFEQVLGMEGQADAMSLLHQRLSQFGRLNTADKVSAEFAIKDKQ